jgi:hypothetical protein
VTTRAPLSFCIARDSLRIILEAKHPIAGATNMARLEPQSHIVPSAKRIPLKAIVYATLCATVIICAHAQEPPKSGSDESWTKTTEKAEQNINPSRTTESHTKSGNRTVDKQRVDVLGPNGGYKPLTETETETVQIDATTTRTVVRTYQWNGNGQRILAQVTEENSRSTASGDVRTERKISSADVNGNFRMLQREVADTRKLSSGAEETKSSVYRSDSYGGFTQVGQTQELKTHGADDSVAVKKTTLLPDGNGNWKVSDVTEKTIKDDGKNRTTEERVSRADLEGRLQESSRTVAKETETASGEEKSIVETYDGDALLNKRVTRTQKRDSTGETTEEKIEGPNLGNPSDGPKVTGRTKYVVKYASPRTQQSPGTQQTKTVEIRDANGNYKVVSVDTQKSTQPPPQQKSDTPADKPDKP